MWRWCRGRTDLRRRRITLPWRSATVAKACRASACPPRRRLFAAGIPPSTSRLQPSLPRSRHRKGFSARWRCANNSVPVSAGRRKQPGTDMNTRKGWRTCFHGGHLLTGDGKQPVRGGMLVVDGKIERLFGPGDEAAVCAMAEDTFDATGMLLTPPLFDAHV